MNIVIKSTSLRRPDLFDEWVRHGAHFDQSRRTMLDLRRRILRKITLSIQQRTPKAVGPAVGLPPEQLSVNSFLTSAN